MNEPPAHPDASGLATELSGPIDLDELHRGPVALPEQIAGYRILGVLGRGGMGIVYRAQQAKPLRDVALKVVGASFMSEQLLRRFELEAHTLGRLKHPGIAQIYEAGTADTGHGPQPFIVMELVEGERLDDYAAKRSLDLRQKLDLLMKLCDAVQYAHQQGVIHRDLKPGNILVTTDGQPKILDFGIARATDADVKNVTLQTTVGQLVGTLPYMSPEQAGGNTDDIDTRSDVYALGVVAFELLSGKLPIETHGVTTLEAARRIREAEPTRLGRLDRALGGEVETIVQKAMEKDKTRRYETANALAADVKRFLNYEPISARPPSAWYQLRKFARRNKALVAGAAMTFVVLIAGTVVSTILYIRAKQQSQYATAVSDFLTKRVLSNATPEQLPDKAVRDAIVKAMLDPAAKTVATDFPDQPLAEAGVRESLAESYRALGYFDRALPHAEAALALRKRELGDDDPITQGSLSGVAALYTKLGRIKEADVAFREALERSRRVLGDDHPDTIVAINNVAVMSRDLNRLDEAERYYREALQRSERALGPDHLTVLRAKSNLAQTLEVQGKLDEAERLAREAFERSRRAYGPDHPSTMFFQSTLGLMLRSQEKLDEAELVLRDALARSQRVLGEDHSDALEVLDMLAGLLNQQGKHAEAEAMNRRVLEGRRRVLGERHRQTLLSMNNLAFSLLRLQRFDEAEAMFREVVEASIDVLGPDDPGTITTLNNIAVCNTSQDKFAAAEPLFREVLERRRRVLGMDHTDTHDSVFDVAMVLYMQDKLAESETFMREALQLRTQRFGRESDEARQVAGRLAALLDESNRPEEAASVRAEYEAPATAPATAPAK